MKKITFFFAPFLFFLSFQSYSQAPANNDCSGAIELFPDAFSCNNSVIVVNLDNNATDSGVDDPGCADYAGGDLWYKLEMPSTGGVRIETREGSLDDNGMAIYTGSCGSLTLYGCNDNGDGIDLLMATMEVAQPATDIIYIRLWAWAGGQIGDFDICAVEIPVPFVATNDDCVDATTLVFNTTCNSIIGSNNATNSEISDPTIPLTSCADTYAGRDVWYKFTVPTTDHFVIETSSDDGSIEDTVIALYSGNCGSNGLTQIDCNDDIGGGNTFSRIEQTSTETELFVRVWSLDNIKLGTFNICALELPTLDTDDFEIQNFKLFPNPTNDIVNLKFNKISANKISIAIYDIQGKLVLNTINKINNNRTQLIVSTLKTGMYILKVNDGNNSLTQKLIIR
jgi:hypothetical protein